MNSLSFEQLKSDAVLFRERYIGSPFTNRIKLTNRLKVQLAFMSVLLAPMRLFFVVTFMACVVIVGRLSGVALEKAKGTPKPLSTLRRKGRNLGCQFFVWAHKAAGLRVSVSGQRASPEEAPILVCGPHTSYFDAFTPAFLGGTAFLGKEDVDRIPLLGHVFRLLQPIYVNRDDPESRHATADLIMERSKLIQSCNDIKVYNQLFVFPEGTTSNNTQLLQFKPGAFAPGLPVQPVLLRWKKRSPDYVSYVHDSNAGALKLFWLSICQPFTDLQISFLPVYVPNQLEKECPLIYANNVRAKLAEHSGELALSPYSLDDVTFITYNAKRPRLERFERQIQKLGLSGVESLCSNSLAHEFELARKTLADYFYVTLPEFHDYLQIVDNNNDEAVQRLFNIFDLKCEGEIDIREYLVARYAALHSEKLIKTAYLMYRHSLVDAIDNETLTKLLRLPFELRRSKIDSIYEGICENYEYVDYASLMSHLRQLKMI